MHADWLLAKPDADARKRATWEDFKTTMEAFYKPSENTTLNNFNFRSVTQLVNETFPTFCNRVERESKTCAFKCKHAVAVRDQIVIGTTNSKIREEALLKSWDLTTLRTEGMKLESATRGEAEISGGAVNKVGKYSYSNLKMKQKSEATTNTINCFNCKEPFKGPAWKHRDRCKARNHECKLCGKTGHLESCCRTVKGVKYTEPDISSEDEELKAVDMTANDLYNVNIFKVTATKQKIFKPTVSNQEFSVEVVVNGSITSVTADTGARVSVTGKYQARKWNLLESANRSTYKAI